MFFKNLKRRAYLVAGLKEHFPEMFAKASHVSPWRLGGFNKRRLDAIGIQTHNLQYACYLLHNYDHAGMGHCGIDDGGYTIERAKRERAEKRAALQAMCDTPAPPSKYTTRDLLDYLMHQLPRVSRAVAEMDWRPHHFDANEALYLLGLKGADLNRALKLLDLMRQNGNLAYETGLLAVASKSADMTLSLELQDAAVNYNEQILALVPA